MNDDEDLPEAEIRSGRRRPFQLIWAIPVVALLIAGFLGWRAIAERGPEITITFSTADGLTAGQTKVRHKAVDLGTVRSISLSDDMRSVIVRVQMDREAARHMTDQARFWVVRPRLTAGNISGLETIVSGAYIELDPGAPGGKPQYHFTGLEEPPAVRSDEPGRTFRLTADRLGSLSSGSPVFFRDVQAGEVLGFKVGKPGEPATLTIFVRAPYDQFVHKDTRFWNASGFAVDLGAQGVQVRLESLQALLSGGVAFDTTGEAETTPVAAPDAEFKLYRDQAAAAAAGFTENLPFVIYLESSVRGLAPGAPVEMFGIPIGTVTEVKLEFDPMTSQARVRVRLEVQPQRIMDPTARRGGDPRSVASELVRRGMRAQLRAANLLTGQMLLALDFFPDAPAVPLPLPQLPDGTVVLPVMPGGLDSITANLSSITQKLNALPLDQIGGNLNETLRQLAATSAQAQTLLRTVNGEAGPALKRLPEISAELQTTLERANGLIASADSGYGEHSEFKRDLQRLMSQFSDTARSLRLLADYLDQHPNALIVGRNGGIPEK